MRNARMNTNHQLDWTDGWQPQAMHHDYSLGLIKPVNNSLGLQALGYNLYLAPALEPLRSEPGNSTTLHSSSRLECRVIDACKLYTEFYLRTYDSTGQSATSRLIVCIEPFLYICTLPPHTLFYAHGLLFLDNESNLYSSMNITCISRT